MKASDCKPGLAVLYQPIVKPDRPKYRAIVREVPWRLGDGTWVTHLSDLEAAYTEGTGGRTFVHGAGLHAIEPEPQLIPRVPNQRCKVTRSNGDGSASLCLVQKNEHSGDCIFAPSEANAPADTCASCGKFFPDKAERCFCGATRSAVPPAPESTAEDRAVVAHLVRQIQQSPDVRYYVGGRGSEMRGLLLAAIKASGFEGDPAQALEPAAHRRDDPTERERLHRQIEELRDELRAVRRG